ncbi:hypothetical protein IJ818_07790 [bacterium]|nr:hypothetical protein [bacterium]
MPIEGFDYKQFSEMLAGQAKELVPAEFDDFQKKYIVQTLLNFSMLAGEAISNDPNMGFNADQAVLLTQIIAEWSFHKSVDLIRSGIDSQYWDGVLQKVAFTIFEIGKQTIQNNIPQDQMLALIEHHVKQAFDGAIDELQQHGVIDETVKQNAQNQSNIDAMVQQAEVQKQEEEAAAAAAQQAEMTQQGIPPEQAQLPPQGTHQAPPQQGGQNKILKLASVALILKTLSQEKVHAILNKFNPDDAQLVIQYMQMNDLETRLDPNVSIQYLKEIKTQLPEPKQLSPSKITERIAKAIKGCENLQSLQEMLKRERPLVRKFIQCAYEGEFYEMPIRIANIVAQHVESSV